jgi:hypothetical protein
MDWNKAIAYGQLVNAAYDDFAGKPPATPGYNIVARIYANDLATDASRLRGTPAAIVFWVVPRGWPSHRIWPRSKSVSR